ncbi:unnamed protein product [Caenorhabditis nigoni]
MSADLIKQNHNLLKDCISYELLQKNKPIFHAYRNFCRTVGQDVMNYPDFEFWYYRFYHGEHNFDYDRSADPEPKTLMDMPVKLMHKIGEYLDPVERTYFRSMNHAIKNVADSLPPNFEKIDIQVSNTSMDWKLNNHSFWCSKKGSGCTIFKNSSKVKESKECHLKTSFEYLAPVLKKANLSVNHFSLTLFDEVIDRDDLLPVSLNAKSAFIYAQTTIKLVEFLTAITPGHLESICIDGLHLKEGETYGLIFETDQFKQARSVEFKSSFNVADLVHFSHLKSFKCFLTSENTFEDVPRMRDIISTFETLESCEMRYNGVSDDSPTREFAGALGAEIPIGPLREGEYLTITHRYQIPESNERLEFKIKEEGEYSCLVNIVKIR